MTSAWSLGSVVDGGQLSAAWMLPRPVAASVEAVRCEDPYLYPVVSGVVDAKEEGATWTCAVLEMRSTMPQAHSDPGIPVPAHTPTHLDTPRAASSMALAPAVPMYRRLCASHVAGRGCHIIACGGAGRLHIMLTACCWQPRLLARSRTWPAAAAAAARLRPSSRRPPRGPSRRAQSRKAKLLVVG